MSLKVIPLLQAFSSAIFRICGALHGTSASAELLINIHTTPVHTLYTYLCAVILSFIVMSTVCSYK